MPKKVLIFSLSYFPMSGGAEVALKEITSRISANKSEFDMVTMRFDKSHLKFEKLGNINIYRISGGSGYLSKILFIPQATFFALRRKYDFYWAMMTYMLFPVVLLRLLGKKIPYLLTLQDGDPYEHVFARLRILPFLPMLIYGFRHASKIQAISNFLAEWAKQMGYRGEVEVIPNGVDIKKFEIQDLRFKNEDEVVLITTSRLVKKNGVGDVIEAMKFLPENVKFRILGTGPLEKGLKLKVNSLQLQHKVEFLGEIPHFDISKCLHEADIFIRPSLSEGQGISFLEGMAAGLPVIATPVGGIPDFLKDGETGIFCEPNNPASIARAVQRLIADEPLKKRIVDNASRMVREKYDWDLIAQEMKSRVFNI
ncbi:MAG: glycosyltransferase family 4 protein [Candidatus Zambryskibacteria bacterium]|nr:glycosyltransferase family 4 protein [Candidatus Zambryskibacteria bacterium]